MNNRGNRFTDRTGERHLNNQGYLATIIAYRGSNDCDVQFEDGFMIEKTTYDSVKNGAIKNPYYPSVFGVGYFGVGIFRAKINKKPTDVYRRWFSILNRCYNIKFHSYHTYKDVTVCEEWRNFQKFAKWYEENYNHEIMEGWQLDKDVLIKNNKTYSPKTCNFVPKEINILFLRCNKDRGECPIGVHRKYDKFASQISIGGVVTHLGYFNTAEEAFQAYKTAKEEHIKQVADKWRGQITECCYKAMYNYQVEITD